MFNLATTPLFTTDGCWISMVADFNGDGRSDILRIGKSGCASAGNFLLISQGDGTFTTVTLPSSLDLEQKKATYSSHSALCTQPMSQPVPATTSRRIEADNFGPAAGTGASRIEERAKGGTLSSCTVEGRTQGKRFYVMDVNGDGTLDFVTTVAVAYSWNSNWGSVPSEGALCSGLGNPSYTGVCSRIYTTNSNGSVAELTTTNIANASLYSDPPDSNSNSNPYWRLPNQADIDGDGLQDILARNTGRWRSLGTGNFASSPVQDSSQLCGLPIDFNGDGRSDCLRPDASASAQKLTISLGAASSGYLVQFNLTNAGDEFYGADVNGRQTVGIVVEDFDGDGRQDILRWGQTAAETGIYLSNGDGSFRARSPAGLGTLLRPLQAADGKSTFVLGDFLGNGTVQVLHLKDTPDAAGDPLDKKNQLYARAGSAIPADLLATVASPTGLVSRVTSRETLSNSTRYASDRGTAQQAVAPVVDLQLPLYVVTGTSRDTVGGTLPTEFSYKGLKAERGGRGIPGFRETRQQSSAPDGRTLTTVAQYLQVYPYAGMAAVSETFLDPLKTFGGGGATRLSRSTFSYCDRTSGNAPAVVAVGGTAPAPCATTAKVQRPYLYQNMEEGWDLNPSFVLPTVTTTKSYNDSGDPLTIKVVTTGTSLGLSQTQTFTKLTTNTFDPVNASGDNWILGRLTKATVQNTVPNLLPSITTTAGISAHATEQSGSGPPPVPAALPPAVLNAILQLLLDD